MNRSLLALATIALLVAPVAARGAVDPTDPVCTLFAPGPCPADNLGLGPVRFVGDLVIGPGEEERWENETVAVSGDVEVEGGGTLHVDASTATFSDESGGIVVRPGGTLRVQSGSNVETLGGPRGEILIDASPGSTIVLVSSSFTGFTVRIATNGATLDNLVFEDSPIALMLVQVSVTVDDSKFRSNDVSIDIDGGSPTVEASEFSDGDLEIDVRDADVDLSFNNFVRSTNAIRLVNSEGIIAFNAAMDKGDPISHAVQVIGANGATSITGNHFDLWGVAVFIRNSAGLVTLSDNTFTNNLVNVDEA